MSVYVTLVQFTDQGIRNVKESPKRFEAGTTALASVGIKVLGGYYTMGAYDMVLITEAEDEQLITAALLALGAQGNVRSTTMRAFSPAEFAAILQKIPPA